MTAADVRRKRESEALRQTLDSPKARLGRRQQTAINVAPVCPVCGQARRSRAHRAHPPVPPRNGVTAGRSAP